MRRLKQRLKTVRRIGILCLSLSIFVTGLIPVPMSMAQMNASEFKVSERDFQVNANPAPSMGIISLGNQIETTAGVEQMPQGIRPILERFDDNMLVVATYYQNELMRWVPEAIRDAVRQLDPDTAQAKFEALSVAQKASLKSDAPLAFDMAQRPNKVTVLAKDTPSEENAFANDDMLIKGSFPSADTISSLNSDGRVDEFSSEYRYESNTDELVHPLYRSANHRVVDFSINGKEDLALSIIRQYNSMDSKAMNPYALFNGQNRQINQLEDVKPDQVRGFIANGWKLILPSAQKQMITQIVEGTFVDAEKRVTYLQKTLAADKPLKPYEKILLTTETGESYEFRDFTPGVGGDQLSPYQYPYEDIVLRRDASKLDRYVLSIRNRVTYTFELGGKKITKTNRFGDTVEFIFNDATTSTNYNQQNNKLCNAKYV